MNAVELFLVLIAVSAVGNALAFGLRRYGYHRAAEIVDKLTIVALGLGQAQTREQAAKEAYKILTVVERTTPDPELASQCRETRKAIRPSQPSLPNIPPGVGSILLALVIVLSALFVTGCGAQKAQLESALEASRDIAAAAEPCLVAQQEQAIEQCTDDACKAKVREAFEPIAKAFDVLHELWCGLSPESEGCK